MNVTVSVTSVVQLYFMCVRDQLTTVYIVLGCNDSDSKIGIVMNALPI